MAKKIKTNIAEPAAEPAYRPGPVGALMDLYEKAIDDLKALVKDMKTADLNLTRNTGNGESYSIRNILLHLVKCGYGYSNRIRKTFGMKTSRSKTGITSAAEAVEQLDNMFRYAVETCADKYSLDNGDLWGTKIKTGWSTYDMEALLEHALVHVMRHRLQIEKLLKK